MNTRLTLYSTGRVGFELVLGLVVEPEPYSRANTEYMSDDEADDQGAALADAYADEFEEEDDKFNSLPPKGKKLKTVGKLREEKSKQAWCLVVKMKFKDYSKVIKLKDIFEEYAAWIQVNEPTTLAYQLMTSDKDPLVVTLFERYTDKDTAYAKVHKGSEAFAKFRPALAALEPDMDGHSYFEGNGFMARSEI